MLGHVRPESAVTMPRNTQLGVRLKVDQSYVSKVERGERYMDVLFFLDWCRACKQHPEAAITVLVKAGA
jgi:hypothetical protein